MSHAAAAPRRPHAILDRESRLLKARKIAELVGRARPLEGARVLDIGTGSGVIASALAELAGPDGAVSAVDVNDQRRVLEGYEFRQVEGTELPFEDGSFDVVLSNHVIEHVGSRSDQLHHLGEVRRVLAAGGVCYLAVPQRWILLEPHFRLPFLSWLPQPIADAYVRRARRGAFYDCRLLTRGRLLALAGEAGFAADEITVDAALAVARIEGGPLARMPERLLRALRPLSPTLVYLLR
jgi:SAM-dependent methyltransferase